MKKFFMTVEDEKVSILDTNPEENVDLLAPIENSSKGNKKDEQKNKIWQTAYQK